MPSLDTADIEPYERRPGWIGRPFRSPGMAFAHRKFRAQTDGEAIVADWSLRE